MTKEIFKMRHLLWFIIFCTISNVRLATSNCLNETMEYCQINISRSTCDLKTDCNVKICKNNEENCIKCKTISQVQNITTLKSIAKYKGKIYFTDENGKVVTMFRNGYTRNIPKDYVYPVMWGNRLLFLNSPDAYRLYDNNTIGKASLTCSHDSQSGAYYFTEKQLSANPQKGIMAGNMRIKINHARGNFGIFIEPINKRCTLQSCRGKKICCILPESEPKKVNLTFISDYVKYFVPFEYLKNPDITVQEQNSSYYWGGREIEFQGKYFSHISSAQLSSPDASAENCTKNGDHMTCLSPSLNDSSNSTEIALHLIMDTYVQQRNLVYYPNPKFKNAEMEDDVVVIPGENLNKAATKAEYTIITKTENCTIQNLESNYIKCTVQDKNTEGTINVTLHSITITLILEKKKDKKLLLYVITPIICLLVIIILWRVWIKCFRSKTKKRKYILTDDYSGQLMSVIVRQGIPYQKMSDYIKRILWMHKPPGNIRYDTQNMSDPLKQSLEQFGHLLKNKYFLLPTLKALEKDKSLSPDHKFTYSYHLSLLFSSDLRYFLELCEELFVSLVSQNKGAKSKKLFLSCTSITEYMILNWLGIAMYSHMKENIGDLLYFFTHAVKKYLEKMPIDEVTGNSYQYLFNKYHLKRNIKYEEIQIQAEMQGIIEVVPTFTCDSIIQLKKKCLAAFYRGRPVSEVPDVDDICIQSNRVPIEEFKKEENAKGFTNHLTVDNWNIEEDSLLKLTFAKAPQVAESNADERYTTLGSSVARITTKSNRKFMHLQEPLDSKTEQILTKTDLKKINLPVNLECKLMELIAKLLESKKIFAPQCCLYNLFKKSADTNGDEKTWLLNSYFKRFCCQLISEPNILLDINQEMYMKKNLEGIKNYTIYILERSLKKPFKDVEMGQNVTKFLSAFPQEGADIKEQMSILQNISDDIKRDVSFSKENSLYYLLKMMKNNYPIIHSALMREEKACCLKLGEKFVNIIEQIEIGQAQRDNFSH